MSTYVIDSAADVQSKWDFGTALALQPAGHGVPHPHHLTVLRYLFVAGHAAAHSGPLRVSQPLLVKADEQRIFAHARCCIRFAALRNFPCVSDCCAHYTS